MDIPCQAEVGKAACLQVYLTEQIKSAAVMMSSR